MKYQDLSYEEAIEVLETYDMSDDNDDLECELPAAYANALRRRLPVSTTTAFATMLRNETSYTMSTGVRFGLSHPYHIFLGYFESFV